MANRYLVTWPMCGMRVPDKLRDTILLPGWRERLPIHHHNELGDPMPVSLAIQTTEPEQMRNGRLLAHILLGVVGVLAVLSVNNLLKQQWAFIVSDLLMICIFTGIYAFNRHGFVRSASVLFVLITVVSPFLLFDRSGLLQSTVILGIPVVLAGLLVAPWSTFVAAAMMTIGLALTGADSDSLMITLTALAILALVSTLFANMLLRMTVVARQQTADLALTNTELAVYSHKQQELLGEQDALVIHQARMMEMLRETEAALTQANDALEARVMMRTADLERSYQTVRVAQHEAESANKARSALLSRISHELRTPLNAILGFGQLLAADNLSALQQESVVYIINGGHKLLVLIDKILDITRIDTDPQTLRIEPVALSEIISEACGMMQNYAQRHGVQLTESGANQRQYWALADRQRLSQVLYNLLSNAIAYNHSGGQVTVSWSQGLPDRLRIVVSDTGCGIAPNDLPKLFSPFERLNAMNSTIEGTGLGLVLAQRLVLAMNGRLLVESTLGQGSTFTIDLPEANLATALQPPVEASQIPPA
jgi:signal transduction histidine kinase